MCDSKIVTNAVVNNVDPSRTTGIRIAFISGLNKRVTELIKAIKIKIVDDDFFRLEKNKLLSINSKGLLEHKYGLINNDTSRVKEFLAWLDDQIATGLLEVNVFNQFLDFSTEYWTNIYIKDSYQRGVATARKQLIDAGKKGVPPLSATGGIGISMAEKEHLERAALFYLRTYNELKGISYEMSRKISTIVTTGVLENISPKVLTKTLIHAVTGKGSLADLPVSYYNQATGRFVSYTMPAKRRMEILARTEVIRAHAQAQLLEYKKWGVLGVNVKAEFRTAGDNRVCEECASLEGQIYSISEASNLLPVHAQCRCMWLPYLPELNK